MIDFVREQQWRDKLRGRNISVQGEFCGPKVNGNRMKLKCFRFFVFTVKDLNDGRLYSLAELQDFCAAQGFEMVPVLRVTQCTEEEWTLGRFQQEANSVRYCRNDSEEGEGVVVRPCVPFHSRVLGKAFSVKLINQKYKD